MTTNKDNRLAIRVRDGEKERLQTVVARVCERNPHMDMTKVMRELIGFDLRRFVTDEEVAYLRGEPFTEEGSRTVPGIGKVDDEQAVKKKKRA
jgi:hypothetical protein